MGRGGEQATRALKAMPDSHHGLKGRAQGLAGPAASRRAGTAAAHSHRPAPSLQGQDSVNAADKWMPSGGGEAGGGCGRDRADSGLVPGLQQLSLLLRESGRTDSGAKLRDSKNRVSTQGPGWRSP